MSGQVPETPSNSWDLSRMTTNRNKTLNLSTSKESWERTSSCMKLHSKGESLGNMWYLEQSVTPKNASGKNQGVRRAGRMRKG